MNTIDPGVRVRIALLTAVSVAALLNATSWALPRVAKAAPDAALALEILAVREGSRSVPVQDRMKVSDFVQIRGSTSERCHLFVLAILQAGGPWRLLGDEGEPGIEVGPGPFEVPGVRELLQIPGPVRFWAACGTAELRYGDVAEAALRTMREADEDSGEVAVREGTELTGLPPGTSTATRLVERPY